MQCYKTELHSPQAKLTFWNEVMHEVFLSAWEVEPALPEKFDMKMRAVPFGGLVLSNASLSQARINNARSQSRDGAHPYHLYMVNQRQYVSTEHRRAVLEPGDFTLVDSTLASSMFTEQPYTTIALTVPLDFLREHVPNPEAATGLRFSGSEGLSRTASMMLRSMWKLGEAGHLPEVGVKLARSLLEVFAACCYISCGPLEQETATARSRRARIKRFIEENLRDPELTVEAIANRFGVSSRYLQMLFAADNQTVSGYIRERRLDECARQLTDPVWRGRGITEIAFGWGFNNAAHFARAFRGHFGTSAREFRKRRTGARVGR
jgi:AraC-like DNA-binding protein